jgi:uncharacterized protein (TIGR00303 family)
MRLMLAAGTTRTATIDGISAAGVDPAVMAHTPSADAELLTYGELVHASVLPVSPTGCPTPAMVTRAAREHLGFDVTTIDAGLTEPTAAPTVDIGASPGDDVRKPTAVSDAAELFERSRTLGTQLSDDALLIAETIPGGTTTALGVLEALGERATVSSSLPDNPLELKSEVVAAGLETSGLAPGDCEGTPIAAIEAVGDPVLAVVSGLTIGAIERGATVTLAGGTQQLAAAALVRHHGFDPGGDLSVATTSYVAEDESAAVSELAADLDVSLTVTDPGFATAERDHVAMARFEAGEAKEGVGMGGALALADDGGDLATVRRRFTALYDRLTSPRSGTDSRPSEREYDGGESDAA